MTTATMTWGDTPARHGDKTRPFAAVSSPAGIFTRTLHDVARRLSALHMVLVERVAGRNRSIAWATPFASGASRLAARARAWEVAAELLDTGACSSAEGASASVGLRDEALGLSAILYVESSRALEKQDRELLAQLLRYLVCAPER